MIENPMISFPLLILFLPLLSFLILIFFGKRLPRQGDWVAVGSIVFTFLLAVYLFVQMLMNYNPDFSNSASIFCAFWSSVRISTLSFFKRF